MSAHAALRSATWPSHQRLEKRLNIAQRFGDPSTYRAHLQRMWGFCAALEQRVEAPLNGEALSDYSARRKLPLLSSDLEFLGMSRESIEGLPRCESLPDCPDPATAFGCMYVLEGATLGGRTLAPFVQERLGFTSRAGAAFLASYGEDTPRMWKSFLASLETCCETPDAERSAAQAASATFDELERWLCRSST